MKNLSQWIQPLVIILGVWGGFPEPPRFIQALSQFELFKWILVFLLAYQGNPQQALIVTVVFYLIFKLLELRDQMMEPVLTAEMVQRQREIAAKAQAAKEPAVVAAPAVVVATTGEIEAEKQAQQTADAGNNGGSEGAEQFWGGQYLRYN